MTELTSLEYFKAQVSDPDFVMYDVMNEPNHPFHEKVMHDINSIPADELADYCNKHNVDFYIGRQENKDLARREWYLVAMLRVQIALERRRMLLESLERPFHYAEELNQSEFDKNGLISTHKFTPNNVGLTIGGNVFQICPCLPGFNSSYWLADIILKEAFQNNRNFMVRLDPLVKVDKDIYNPMFFKMLVYGKKLDWERLKTLKAIEDGRWLGENSYSNFTDYVWEPNETEIHFTCEELPKDEDASIQGSRYLHAIFDKKKGIITHCDGANRFYTPEELEYRKKYHVKNAEVRKMGKRVKIFQIDESIDQILFMSLATNFLVWNEDVLHYFN